MEIKYTFCGGVLKVTDVTEDLRFLETEKFADEILVLECQGRGVKHLPNLKNVRKVWCYCNQIKTIPNWENIEFVDCSNNQIETLPNWKSIKEVWCYSNQLNSLPKWKSVQKIYCYFNQIKIIPNWKEAVRINFSSNLVKIYPEWKNRELVTADDNLILSKPVECWRLHHLLFLKKIILAFYMKKIFNTAETLESVNIELLYSPDLNFYKDREEYKHFIQTQHT